MSRHYRPSLPVLMASRSSFRVRDESGPSSISACSLLRCQQDLAVFVREIFCALSRRIRHLVRRPYPGLSRTLHGHVHGRVFTCEVYAAFRPGNVRIQGGDLAGCIVSPRS